MRLLGAFLAAAALAALPACVSFPAVHTDRNLDVDPGTFPTYAWFETDHPDDGVTDLLGAEHDALIRAAGDTMFAEKGYRPDPNPAFLVNWHVVVQERIDTAAMADYYGYGRGWRKWAMPTYPSAAMPVSSDRNEEGTIVIDLMTAADHELYWRGFMTGVVDPSVGIQERRERMETIVRTVLSQLPPAK